MKLLMYLLYGDNIAYYHEAKYSILSGLSYLSDKKEDIEIIVVTDQPDYFSNFPVLIETFDSEQYNNWIGEARYNHRAKNRAMAMILEKYQVPLAFVDTDTFFIDHPIKIFNRISKENTVLFNYEALISNIPNIHNKLHNTSFKDFYNKTYNFPEDAAMWNSGVIGLLPEHKILLDEALVLLDNFYTLSDGIFIIEQLAISEALRNKTKVSAVDDILVHYFGKEKPFYDQQIKYYLSNQSELDLIKNPDMFKQLKLSIPKPPALYRMWEKIRLEFSGIRDNKLKKALLELYYARFDYQTEIEKITKDIWFARVIKHLSSVYSRLEEKRIHPQKNIVKTLNHQTDWIEKHSFDDKLIQQWHSLIKKFNNT